MLLFPPAFPERLVNIVSGEENSVVGKQTELKGMCSEGISEKEQVLL